MSHDDATRVFSAGGPEPEHLVGSVLAGRYRILELLGVGAMGAVYLGEHLKIGRKDAIKVLQTELARDPDAVARFDRGARNVGAIRHPNVCTIYDFSETDDGLQYLAMEYVPGESLKDVLDREGTLPLGRAVELASQIAAALQAAHDAGIVHRDLKPANVMLAPRAGGGEAVKVVDFDISKGSTEAVQEEVTRLGFVVGTPEYMSPEQLWGDALDGRSDVYSLALVLYRMLTGSLPFRGETMQETMSARLKDAPLLRLEEVALGHTFPPALQDVLDRALQCKPADRTASAAELAAQLRAVVAPAPASSGAGAALPATRVARGAGPERSAERVPPPAAGKGGGHRRALGIAAALVLLTLAGVAVERVGLLGGDADDAPPSVPAGGEEAVVAGDPATGAPAVAAPADPAPGGQRSAASSPDGGGTPGEPDGVRGGPPSSGTGPGPAAPATSPGAGTGTESGPAVPMGADPAPAPGPAAGIPPGRAPAILAAQRMRLARSPAPGPATLRAMRDTAEWLFTLEGVAPGDRATAAFVAANLSLILGERAACTLWAGRAAEGAPGNATYAGFAAACAPEHR